MANFFEQYIRQDQNDESDPFAKYDGAGSMQSDDAEDEDPFAKYDAPEPVRDTSNTTEYSNPIARGFSAGVDQLQGMGGGAAALVGDLVGSDTVRDWGIDVYRQNMAEAAVNQNKQPFTEIDSVTDALGWAGYTLGNLAPMVAPSLLTGGAGGLIAKQGTQALAKRLVAEQVAKGVSQKQAAKIAGTEVAKRIAAGSTAGAGAASIGMSSGEIYGDTEDAGVSLTHGIVAGAVDALPVMRVLDKFGLGKTAGDAVKKNVLAEAGKQSLFEGGTEAFQTLVEQHAKHWVDNNGESLLANLGEVKWGEVLEASAAGALGGAVMGAPSQMFENSRIGQQDRQKEVQRNRAAKIEAAKQAARDRGGDELDVELAGANTALDIESTDIESYISGDPIAEDRDTRSDIAPVTTFGPQAGSNGLLSGAATMPQDYPAWQPSQPTQPVIDPIANKQATAPLEIAAKGEYPVAGADQLTQLSGIDVPTDQYREQPDTVNKYTARSLMDASSERSEQSASTAKNAFEDTFAAASQEPNTKIPDTQRPTEDNKADEATPQLDDSIAIEPVTIWTGRKGDGYDTAEDAQKAISSRAKTNPDLQWQAEQMPSGKYRLAGYQQSESGDVQQDSDSLPEAQITEPADQPVNEQPTLDLPEILATPRKQYINRMTKEAGIKKDSPGYKNAIADIESRYEQEAEQALGNVSFEQYQSLNQDQPESVNRQAHAALVEEYGVEKQEGLNKAPDTTYPKVAKQLDDGGANQALNVTNDPIIPVNPENTITPTVKADGSPFGSERMALASARQKKIANPVAVQVGEGWGYTETANVPDGRAGRDSALPVEQTNLETGRTGAVGSDDGVSSSVGRTGEADAGSGNNATGGDGVAVEGAALTRPYRSLEDREEVVSRLSDDAPRWAYSKIKDAAEYGAAEGEIESALASINEDDGSAIDELVSVKAAQNKGLKQGFGPMSAPDAAYRNVKPSNHPIDVDRYGALQSLSVEDLSRVARASGASVGRSLSQEQLINRIDDQSVSDIRRAYDEVVSPPPTPGQTTTEGAQQAPLSTSAPVEFDGTEFGGREQPIKQLMAKAVSFARRSFAGKSVTNQSDGGEIILSTQGMKKAASGAKKPAAAIAFAKLDEIVAGAKYKFSEPDSKNRNTIKEIRHYESEINIAGEPTKIGVVVRVADDGRRYYDHFEIIGEKENPATGKRESDSIQWDSGVPSDNNAPDNPASQPTLSKSGKPFRGKGSAILAGKKAGIANPQAVEVDGGWGYVATSDNSQSMPSLSENKAKNFTPNQRRAIEILGGAEVGDVVVPSSDTGYVSGGVAYRINEITRSGVVHFTNISKGSSTSLSSGEMSRAGRTGVKFERQSPTAEAVPVESSTSQEAKPTDDAELNESAAENVESDQESKAATTEDTAATNQKIEDFGETLEGARKHTALKYVETMEDESIDVAAEPLTKSFPAPNYKKMASDGVDKKSLAIIAVLRDLIPPKPRKSWKAKRWAEDVSRKRQLAKELIEQGKDFKQSWRLIDELSEYDVGATAEAIKDLPAEDFPKAAKYKIATGEFSLADGVQYNPPKQLWYIKGPNGRRVNASILDNVSSIGDYKESEADAIAAAKELMPKMIGKADGQKTRSKYTEVNVYRDRTTGDRFLAFKARSSVIRLKGGFESLTEARDYLQENRDEIQDKIDSMRRGPNMRGTENRGRSGISRREAAPDLSSTIQSIVDRSQIAANSLSDIIIAHAGGAELPSFIDVPLEAVPLSGGASEVDAGINQRPAYRLSVFSKFLGNLYDTNTLTVEGYSRLDVPAKRLVKSAMLAIGHDSKIRRSIIELVPVDVVDNLSGTKFSAQELFSDESMLGSGLAIKGDVSVGSPEPSVLAFIRAVARVTAKVSFTNNIARIALKGDPAVQAGEVDSVASEFSGHDMDVTPQDFQDAFSFFGVQFGNYVENSRRQQDLNRAYDALMDLADAVGVPPKALSLNGSLGLAFGARGKGGRNSAAAHYEPGTVVINLTKNAGPGSLSHEWLHALDNYFGEQDKSGGYISRNSKSGGGTRQEVFDAWKKVEAAISSGEFTNRSAEFDKARSKPYFNTTIEKAARAFERYTIDRLDEKGVTNDYLANIDMEGGAYPTADEMQQDGIREAFDTLFDTIESKETDQGVMLYSRQSTLADDATPKGVGKGTAQLAVNRFMNQYKGADDVKVVIAENYEEAFGSPAEFRTKGGYDPKTDTLYLFTGELDSVTDLNETLRHEILVHKGLGMVEPARLKQFLDSFYEAAKDSRELTQIVDEVERVESKRSDRLKAEEILARIAQEKPSLTDKIWNRIVLAVQRMLSRHGLWDVSAKRRGKDMVYRIGDAFAEGKRAAPRENMTGMVYSYEADQQGLKDFWKEWQNDENRSDKQWLAQNLAGRNTQTREHGAILSTASGSRSGKPIIRYESEIAGFQGYNTLASDIGDGGFIFRVIPNEYLENLGSIKDPWEVSVFTATFTPVGDGFELGILGPKDGSIAQQDLADTNHLEDTGESFDEGEKYYRLKIGNALTKSLLSEAVRRLTLSKNRIPEFVEYSRRDTGARAGDNAGRAFDSETIQRFFSRDNGPESPAWKAAKAKGLDMSKSARMKRARDMGFDTDTVYYHGTKSSSEVDSLRASQDGMLGKGVYITDDIGKAEKYAGMGMQYSDGGSVYPLYIKDGEIWDVADKGFPRDELQGTNDDLVDELSSRGFIGIKDGKETVLFDPANIRSVNAAFDPDEAASPNLMFSRTDDTFTPPVEERMSDKFLRNVQDKFRPLKRLQDAIKKSGGTVNDATDTYMAEEAFYGKTENDLKKLERRLIEPLVASMTENDISREELDLFLVANHAEERNAYIATINPDMPDGGSGMTNAAAEAVMAKFSKDGKLDAVKAVADHVYKITETRRRILEDAGLVDADYMAQFETPYKNYVPLKGFAENESEGRAKVGRGFDIRGKEDLRAMGRRTMAESPTLHAIQDMTASAIRLRKNEVGQTFLRMVEANPNPDYWEVFDSENPDTRRTMVNGVVTEQPITNMGMLKDDYFAVKKGGKEYFIKVKDKRVQNALQNIGPEQMNVFMQSMGKVTRFLSAVNTSYNPEFMISNVSRDIQTAVYNALAEEDITDGKIKGTGKAIAARMVKNVPKSARAIWIEQGKGVDESAEDITEYRQYYREFLADGAKTGYFDSKDIDGLTKELSARLSMANGGVVGGARKTKKAIGDFVERMNSSIENAVRLSGYIEARKAGVSRKKAASFAKSMTVNFNKRGELGANLNAVYLFFNASAQGTANFARAIATIESSEYGRALSNGYTGKRLNTAQKAAGVMMAGAFALSALNREMAGDDDDGENFYDKVPEHVRERNIVIMKSIWGGPEGEYTTIPLPYGYNIFYNLGDAAEAARNSKSKKRKEGLALGLGLSAFGSFSPIGAHKGDNAAAALGLTFTPTVMLPVVEIATNTNFFGSDIYRKNYEYGPEKSDAVLSMRSTKQMYKSIAEFLNEVTGGSTYESGAIDISPDTLEHLAEFGLGGMYRLADRSIETVDALTDGRELETRNIPFYRKVTGEVQPYADIADFYDARQKIENLKAESEILKGRERIDFIRENKDRLRLEGLMDSTYGRLRNLNKRRDRIEEDESLTDAQRDERLRVIEAMKKREVDRFNKRWDAAA